jgi:hypothetical protein
VRDEVRLDRERGEREREERDQVRLVGAEHIGVPVCRAVISVFQSAPRPLAAARHLLLKISLRLHIHTLS